MNLSTQKWHERYHQQARWTKSLRDYVYKRIGFHQAKLILDVGCGTGVILGELSQISTCTTFGVDIDPAVIRFAHSISPKSLLSIGNGFNLPFRAESFDVSQCHFLLLWVTNPRQVLIEMVRVLRPGGYLLVLAEPDYGGRIDYPTELAKLGSWQIEALKLQGANPYIGREIRSLFSNAGLLDIEVGVLGGQWGEKHSKKEAELEWEVIKSDLYQNKEFLESAARLETLDLSARKNLQRILFVPTFYAIGIKPG
jgi:ubiquinone/menaquinone biosynthesis C-methylase UbiE